VTRELAEDMLILGAKQRLLKLADGYDALALKAEQRRAEKRAKPGKPK
jgi:hypothetical protein